MVAKVLKFMVAISPLLSFALMPCISPEAVNGIGFEELAPTEGASDSLKGRI
jgi:hypothetical protein